MQICIRRTQQSYAHTMEIPWQIPKNSNDAQKFCKNVDIKTKTYTALGMELINAFCISNLYFKRLQLDVREETVHCFALRDFSLLALIACTTLFINPVFAFTTIQYVPHKQRHCTLLVPIHPHSVGTSVLYCCLTSCTVVGSNI